MTNAFLPVKIIIKNRDNSLAEIIAHNEKSYQDVLRFFDLHHEYHMRRYQTIPEVGKEPSLLIYVDASGFIFQFDEVSEHDRTLVSLAFEYLLKTGNEGSDEV